MKQYTIERSALSYFFTADTRSAPLWFIVRVYLGWQWFEAGWGKFQNPAWFGPDAGGAISGFAQGALHKTATYCTNAAACHPDVQDWYAAFLQNTLLAHPYLWSHMITLGEMAVGLGLIVGCLTGVAAFFGILMNLDFMLAGSISVNPIWFVLGLGIVLAWRVSGYWGADRYVLPFLRHYVGRRRQGG